MRAYAFLFFAVLHLLSCRPVEEVEDIVVIGGGLMGSSAAWQLSRQGQQVLLMEQQDSVYTFGSSFGDARISRSLGPQGDIFSYLQQLSVRETKELINYLNENEPAPLHHMEDIYTTSPVTYIYYRSQQEEVEVLLDGQMDRHEYAANSEEAFDKFGVTIPDSLMIVREFKEYSGTLNPHILIRKLQAGIRKTGNKVDFNQQVSGLTKKNGHYEIKTTNTRSGGEKTILAKKVVLAAGPYNGQLLFDLAPYFNQLITPKRLFLSFLKVRPDKYDELTLEEQSRLKESYPVALFNSEIYYSMIERFDENDRPVIKVGGHLLRTDITNLDQVWTKALSQEEIDWSKARTTAYFNILNLPIAFTDLEYTSGYSCVYSLTPSEVPYVSHVINEDMTVDPNLVLVGGMSGIGAKGSLAYGLIASDLLLNKASDTSGIYQKTKAALGTERLHRDIRELSTQ